MNKRIPNGIMIMEKRTGRKMKIIHSIKADDDFLYCTDYYKGTGFWLFRHEFVII